MRFSGDNETRWHLIADHEAPYEQLTDIEKAKETDE
jgi:hypothetical protein